MKNFTLISNIPPRIFQTNLGNSYAEADQLKPHQQRECIAMTSVTPDQIPLETAQKKEESFWTGTMLISGTCIGGGMLAMPVHTAEVGFFISLLCLFVCWAFMTYTGLLLVEATLWVKNETHFSSLSRILIGNWVKVIALVVYLFMNYASLVAYTAGGGTLITMWSEAFFNLPLSYEVGCVIFTILFGFIILLGSQFVGALNFWLMIGLVVSFVGLLGIGFNHIEHSNLAFRHTWKESLGTFSMILATFSYQMVVPAVCAYMKYDVSKLKKAVITGTTIPFVTYALWIFVIHGAVALDGEGGLRDAWVQGHSATVSLRKQLDHGFITALADSFGFLAIVTSYLGLSLALFYFLKDCFNEMKIEIGKNLIIFLTVLPTMLLAILFPRALLKFLDLSGGYGDTILSGLIPIGLVWVGRYNKKLESIYRVPGGRAALVLSVVFFFGILLLQIV